MSSSAPYLSPSQAALRLGVSAKALRLYEERGLVAPLRTAAGWRAYGPAEMARAAEVAALRALGLSLTQAARALAGDAEALAPALVAQEAALVRRMGELSEAVAKVRALRAGLTCGEAPTMAEVVGLAGPATPALTFELPWPWGGEPFSLPVLRPLTFIVGPLGSGKTRLSMRIAEALPGAVFVGLDREAGRPAETRTLRARVDAALAWLVEDGATRSDALEALLAHLENDGHAAAVIDLVEQGLDEATQGALVAHLRRRGSSATPLFLMTRSTAILDLEAVGPDETILLCPANHSPPTLVTPVVGAPGYEAVATCLAPPAVRARTEGMRAVQPHAA